MRNQFRSLDEDEVDFLDSVLESTRSKEAEVKKDTREQLEAFRKQQEDAEKVARTEDDGAEASPAAESWSLGPRKRKKGSERETLGGVVKLRKASTTERERERENVSPPIVAKGIKASAQAYGPPAVKGTAVAKEERLESSKATPSVVAPSLGLGAYSSDEDE